MLEGEYVSVARAWDFQREAGVSDVPVEIEKYLAFANVDLRISFDLRDDEAGQTFPIGEGHIIVVNGHQSIERQRFTVLHELAHIRLELPSIHGQSISIDQLLRYHIRPREEILCDIFASECLLPRQHFIVDVRKRPCTMQSIQELADLYSASLTATGSRFAAYNETPCAWLLADEGRIRYVSCSRTMREMGFFLNIGTQVPAKSVLGRLLVGTSNVTAGVPDIVPSYIWINNDCRGCEEFTETSVGALGRSQGLALLVAEDVQPGAVLSRDALQDDDDLLPELDGILKFPDRKRRK